MNTLFRPLSHSSGTSLGLALIIGGALVLLALRIAAGFAELGHPGI